MPNTSFSVYQREGKRRLYERFTTGNYVVAVRDTVALQKFVRPTALKPLSDRYGLSALIVSYGAGSTGYSELWLDPKFKRYRDAHLSFFDSINVEVPPDILNGGGSDHAFPRSAGNNEAGLTLMNFIDRNLNSSFGGGWEKRLKHRVMAEGLPAWGNLVDLAKALGHRLNDSLDYTGSIMRLPDVLIAAGDAPPSDRPALEHAAQQALEDWKQQDIALAVRDKQIVL
ncbi:hypothetical protein [Polymorphobacter megasporae]|uniref:hypothetical protein n=1 Tax=Glacieibacterium megasporae TaxID=2835787 RepID=UPI001C1DDC1B|nr:hypothetical protein [Polymorphobacter megasporae]UAJ10151.1 hypothetical protein KTC28_18115 [Polymorphobacter megasporae]